KDFIYKANQVTLTCLQLINVERQNEMINIRFIRAVVESYIVSRWIDEELHRVQSYLHSSTSASLIKKT
ncbi:unnamed protein product, partial [Rotaria sp. Silwood1]